MKVYVVVRNVNYECVYDYCGVAATLDKAKEILQDILDNQFEIEESLTSFEVQDCGNYWVYIIDGVQFEIWEEVI